MNTTAPAMMKPARHTAAIGFQRHWSLVTILLLQVVTAFSLQNTAFQDEALYLYAGRQYFNWLIGGSSVTEPYALYFSGLPYLYPPLAGALDALGGLELARLLSLICMLTATAALYLAGAALFGWSVGLLGAALFAVQAPVIFLGRLATYDAPSLMLLAVALALATRAERAGWERWAWMLGPLLLLAVATKYAALLFVPSVVAVATLQARQRGPGPAVIAIVLPISMAAALCAVIGLMFAHHFQDILVGLRSTTTNRETLFQMPRFELAGRAFAIGGVLLLLSGAGAVLAARNVLRATLVTVLLATALLPIGYHIFFAEAISMHKHIAFGMVFAAPLAGLFTARLGGLVRQRFMARWPAALGVALLLFALALPQAQAFYAEWPRSDMMIHALRTQVRPGAGRILAEESEVPRYYLQDVVAFWQWNHLYWFYYTDRSGQPLQGEEAYRAAIAEGYFELVVLRYGPNSVLAHKIDDGLKNGGQYELLTRIPFSTTFGEGDYWIWRRARQNAAVTP